MSDREKMIEVIAKSQFDSGDWIGNLADRLIAAGFGMVRNVYSGPSVRYWECPGCGVMRNDTEYHDCKNGGRQ